MLLTHSQNIIIYSVHHKANLQPLYGSIFSSHSYPLLCLAYKLSYFAKSLKKCANHFNFKYRSTSCLSPPPRHKNALCVFIFVLVTFLTATIIENISDEKRSLTLNYQPSRASQSQVSVCTKTCSSIPPEHHMYHVKRQYCEAQIIAALCNVSSAILGLSQHYETH